MTVQTGLLPDLSDNPVNNFFRAISNEGLWKRAGVITVGVMLVLIGVVLLIAGSRAVKQLASTATGVASKVVTKGIA